MLQENSTNALANTTWGAEGTSSKDLVIPKIQLNQASSNASKEGLARPGEIIISTTKEMLCAKGGKLEILPISCVGSWNVSKIIAGQSPKFLRKYPLTKENDSDIWKKEDFEDTQAVTHDKCLTFLVLLVSRSNGFPFFMDFSRTNKNGGKLLSTIMQENNFKGKPAPSRVVEVTTGIKTYNGNSWFTYGVTPTRDATNEELIACKRWFDLFSAKQVEMLEEEDNGVL